MAGQDKPKKSLDKRDLAIAAIGMLLGAAGGAAVHPLATQKPSTGGYIASAAVGAGLGAPTALLIANSMKQSKDNSGLTTLKEAWGSTVDAAGGVLDSVGRAFTGEKYTKQDQRFRSESNKTGQKIGDALRSLLPDSWAGEQGYTADTAWNHTWRGGLAGAGFLGGLVSGLKAQKKWIDKNVAGLSKAKADLLRFNLKKGQKLHGVSKYDIARPGKRAFKLGLGGLLAGAVIDYFTNPKFKVYDK